MQLHGEILRVDSVLAWSVDVELSQLVVLATSLERAVDRHLESAAEVLKLSSKGVRVHAEGDGAAPGGGDGIVQDNGRLVLAGGTQLVGSLVEPVPVQRANESIVAESADRDGMFSGVEMGSVVAGSECRSRQGEGNGCEPSESSHLYRLSGRRVEIEWK